jgi:2-alkyl-3-oxoalkanoate reductase
MHIGIVGCGGITHYHIPHLLQLRGAQSVMVADADPRKAEEVAGRYRLKHVFPDLESMLRDRPPDVVHILTPPATHAMLAIRAMEQGCHTLVEKPMALLPKEAENMIAAAKANNVQLCVNHNLLFGPVMARLMKWKNQGHFGRILHVEASFGFDTSRTGHLRDEGHWIFRLPGGPITDYLPHPASLLFAFLAGPVTVNAVAKNRGHLPGGFADELRLLVNSEEVTGLVSVSLGVKPDCICLDIYGTEMSAHANLSNLSLVRRSVSRFPKKISRALDSLGHAAQLFSSTAGNTVRVLAGRAAPPGDVGELIAGFYQGIETGNPPPVTGEDGLRVVRLIHEACSQTETRQHAGKQANKPAAQPQFPGAKMAVSERRHPAISISGRNQVQALVTGASGFLGSHLVARLARDGFRVRALVRNRDRAAHLAADGVDVVIGDLKDRGSLQPAVEGVDLVFHAGAATRGDWREYEESTIAGTEHILELSQAAGVRKFVYVSSVSVYQVFGFERNAVIDENSPLESRPAKVGPYTYSKVEAEKKVLQYAQRGLPVSIIRPGLIYGPRGRVLFPHLGFPVKGRLFIIVGDGATTMPLTYIDNTIDAFLLAAASDQAVGRIYNVVDEQEITVADYLKRFMAATGTSFRVVRAPLSLIMNGIKMAERLKKAGFPATMPTVYGFSSKYNGLRYDSAKIRNELSWSPRVALEEGLEKTFSWYRNEVAGKKI